MSDSRSELEAEQRRLELERSRLIRAGADPGALLVPGIPAGAAYGIRTGEALREAAARVSRWTYTPSQPGRMLELSRDIAELRNALADELAADQLEAFHGLPVADPYDGA